jgi:hypothetical protein
LFACKSDRKISDVKDLSEYKRTKFIPTLENSIGQDNNYVYCATLLFAWDEVRKIIDSPISISPIDHDVVQLNESNSFLNVLNKNEFNSSGSIVGTDIMINAKFKKSIPFEFALNDFKGKLKFKDIKVSSFGLHGYDKWQMTNVVKIIYYKNDDNFIIKLHPKDSSQEIVLFKTDEEFRSIAYMINEIDVMSKKGIIEKSNDKSRWKYYLNNDDIVIIPKFNFNIQTSYNTIEGRKISAKGKNYQITKAWQRTAFLLDESGAEIESEADAPNDENLPRPKHLVFDKPFLIILKKSNSRFPYFAMWTANSELMTKE